MLNRTTDLKQAYILDREREMLVKKKEKMQELLTDLSHNRTARGYAACVETAAKIGEYESEIDSKICEIVNKRIEIEKIIASVPNDIHREVLERRYLLYQPWETYFDREKQAEVSGIADEMNYSVRQIFRFHKAALESLGKIIN